MMSTNYCSSLLHTSVGRTCVLCLLLLVLFLLIAGLYVLTMTGEKEKNKGLEMDNFDHSVSPKENFYLWANGGWKAKNPIPSEYSSWNAFIQLRDLNLERLKVIVEDDLKKTPDESVGESPSSNSMKLSAFFKAMSNEEAIEARGLSPLYPIFELCNSFQVDAASALAGLHSSYDVNVLFSFHSSPDKKDANHTIGTLFQGGLGLLDRDYYFDEDKEEKRSKYVEYIETVFAMLGRYGVLEYKDAKAQQEAAASVFRLEFSLASSHLTRTECRDPNATYNIKSLDELQTACNEAAAEAAKKATRESSVGMSWSDYLTRPPLAFVEPNHDEFSTKFDWEKYFTLVGKRKEDLGKLNVATVNAIKKAFELITLSKNDMRHYLVFHVVVSFSEGHLPREFHAAHFDFYEKIMKGTAEMKPRWKVVLAALGDCMGDALGQLYVSKYFPGDAKAKALGIVNTVKESLRERLTEVDWMSEETRTEALRKMDNFRVKIGFPDKWVDYSSLEIGQENHFENEISSRQFHFKREIARINAPTDRDRWFMTPQTVNAYYHPSLNEIVFPAAILQPPLYQPEADDAINFGSLGAVVGHEMTHGFDDQGRKYDSIGNMRDWWSAGDGDEYERRVRVMVQQAEQFEVQGRKLNGKLTCGENIADLGGVKLALRALKTFLKARGRSEMPLIDGFTPEQRFFLAWAQAWRENSTKDRALQLLTLDPHGPNELRCNGTLSNIPEFFEEFGITSGDAMFVSEKDRVDIW